MNHLANIQAKLKHYDLEAMLVTSEPGEAYAVGFHGEGVVLVTEGDCCYYTDSRYIEAARAQVTGCSVAAVSRGRDHLALAQAEIARQGLRRVGIQEDAMTLREYRRWQEALGSGVELIPAGALLLELRASKDEEELERMRAAQAVTDKTFLEILNHLKPGVTEQEIAAKLTYYQMKFGGARNSFDPIVASGPNGSMPHAVPGPRAIGSGEFVTMDFGCMVGGYCSDMTRTVAVGRPTEEMERVYQTVLRAQLAGIAAVHAGVVGNQVDGAARRVIEQAGYGEYFGHGFGHSLGLEIHESPNFNPSCQTPIPEGAVLSAEPGIYLPGQFGVRIEDVVWVRSEGCEILTCSPKELIVL